MDAPAPTSPLAFALPPSAESLVTPAEIEPAHPVGLMVAEVAALPPDQVLVENGPYVVLRFRADQAPHLLHEVGRQREIAFRAVGEGTGRSLDLDIFDQWYDQLVVWNRETSAVLGAYRAGRSDEILATHGLAGLYTSTLFHYTDTILENMSPFLELGRSFVTASQQRAGYSLMLLWKGIAAALMREPRYRRLVGPVSIDRRYKPASLQLMVGFLSSRYLNSEAAGHVSARVPYQPSEADALERLAQGAGLNDTDALARVVADIEEGRGIPVLVRQYLRLGSEVLGFNVDPDFSNVVDALMLLDLDRVDGDRLAWFMGREGADGYRSTATRGAAPG